MHPDYKTLDTIAEGEEYPYMDVAAEGQEVYMVPGNADSPVISQEPNSILQTSRCDQKTQATLSQLQTLIKERLPRFSEGQEQANSMLNRGSQAIISYESNLTCLRHVHRNRIYLQKLSTSDEYMIHFYLNNNQHNENNFSQITEESTFSTHFSNMSTSTESNISSDQLSFNYNDNTHQWENNDYSSCTSSSDVTEKEQKLYLYTLRNMTMTDVEDARLDDSIDEETKLEILHKSIRHIKYLRGDLG